MLTFCMYKVCKVCKGKFKAGYDYICHMQKNCGEKLEGNTTARINSKKKAYKCNSCCKCFTTAFQLKRHEQIHSGVKPYACGICKVTFTLSHHLIDHLTRHTGEKPYVCIFCKHSYAQHSTLRQHQRRVHKITFTSSRKSQRSKETIRQFTCSLCKMKFTSIVDWAEHMCTLWYPET